MPAIYLTDFIRIRGIDSTVWVVEWFDQPTGTWVEKIRVDADTGDLELPLSLKHSTPTLWLKGTEAGGITVGIREDSGKVLFVDETGARREKLLHYDLLLGADYSIWGSGKDGAITETAAVTRSGLLFPTTYDDGGYTITVGDTCLAIIAKEKITISGTINASGKGGTGGSGGAGGTGLSTGSLGGSSSGGNGGEWGVAAGAGTNATDSLGGNGGAGGDAGDSDPPDAGGAGGGAGVATTPAAGDGGFRATPMAILLRDLVGGVPITGGAGGGGGTTF